MPRTDQQMGEGKRERETLALSSSILILTKRGRFRKHFAESF